MQDFQLVSFFLGHRKGEEARRLLRSCNLLDVALSDRANRNSWSGELHLGVYVRLPVEDQRIKILLEQLHQRGVEPFTRIDREYSGWELEQADWLILRVATAGLYGGIDYNQEYVPDNGCQTCGAGVTPIAPLVAELGKMGKKDLDHLVYEGHLVASSRVARELTRLSGVEALPVRSPRRPPDARFKWLRITSSFPRMHPSTTGVVTENVCSTCGRGGHYADPLHPETPVYETVPRLVSDLNYTWEYFGDWQQVRNVSNRNRVGGYRGIIVSKRVRQAIQQLNVRRLVWVPITILKRNGPRPDVGEERTCPPNTLHRLAAPPRSLPIRDVTDGRPSVS
jgi:hypothetical protein